MSEASDFSLEDARTIALEVHEHQTDKAGDPYMLHVESVAAGLVDFGPELEIAGMLHDVVEDSLEQTGRQITIDDLRDRGVPERSLASIALVSNNLHADETSYLDKILRISDSPDATLVKISDNAHNSLADRIAKLGRPADPKYADARKILHAAASPEDIALILRRVNPALLEEIEAE